MKLLHPFKRHYHRHKHRWMSKLIPMRIQRLPRWKRWPLYIVVVFLLLWGVNTLIDRTFPVTKNPVYGVSFSVKYAQELGVDWQANFIALLDDLKIRNYRLMSYWDSIEPERGKYDFTDLDWQMNEAAKRGAKVSLAIGMRQPRWPECYKPSWYGSLSKAEQDQALMEYLKSVVKHYDHHPALLSYQLENEAVNNWFGTCTKADIDKQRLDKEYNYVKRLDPDHPIWMSLSDQHGLPIGQPTPDKYGYSVYRVVWNNKTGPLKFYMTYPTPVWYHRLRALWIKTFKHRDIFVHELQVEPWGPAGTKDLSIKEQNRSMDSTQIRENFHFAKQIGTPEIYTWGGEWWYWRKTTLNDPSIWEAVRTELNRP
jgi:hypothetical protein